LDLGFSVFQTILDLERVIGFSMVWGLFQGIIVRGVTGIGLGSWFFSNAGQKIEVD
jgi:hypothetical protein